VLYRVHLKIVGGDSQSVKSAWRLRLLPGA
jgi:hypothetical protein